jgi:hypothetical protein
VKGSRNEKSLEAINFNNKGIEQQATGGWLREEGYQNEKSPEATNSISHSPVCGGRTVRNFNPGAG